MYHVSCVHRPNIELFSIMVPVCRARDRRHPRFQHRATPIFDTSYTTLTVHAMSTRTLQKWQAEYGEKDLGVILALVSAVSVGEGLHTSNSTTNLLA